MYNYVANEDSPGGFNELSLKKGEKTIALLEYVLYTLASIVLDMLT